MNIVSIQNLYKNYGKKKCLEDINLTLKEGEFLSLIGKNGAGKTTLIRILTGILKFNSGSVLINEIPIKKTKKINKLIGVVQQDKGLPEQLTVHEYVLFQAKLKKVERKFAEQLLDISDLRKFENTLIDFLSGGSRRKLHIMTSIINKPRLLIMDEPTVGLDPIVRKDIWNYIKILKGMGVSAVISTHYLKEAEELGDKIAVIDNGKVIHYGTKSEIESLCALENGIELETFTDQPKEVVEFLFSQNLEYVNQIRTEKNKIKLFTDRVDYSFLPDIVRRLDKKMHHIKMIKYFEFSLNDILEKIHYQE